MFRQTERKEWFIEDIEFKIWSDKQKEQEIKENRKRTTNIKGKSNKN